jgi:hypothetical protein
MRGMHVELHRDTLGHEVLHGKRARNATRIAELFGLFGPSDLIVAL